MVDTFFNVPPEKMDRFLPNHSWDGEEEKLVQMGEEASRGYIDTEMFSGGGGLVSTVMDYMRFCEMVRRGGELGGVRLLPLMSPRTVEFMTANHLPGTIPSGGNGEQPLGGTARGFGFGLGWGVNTDPIAAGILSSAGEYYWRGVAGTLFWIDPVQEIVAIGMIQLMWSPWPLREDMQVASNQAIIEAY